MRAMTYRGPYKVRVEDKPDPRIEHPNDAIVRVERAAICGSDLHLYHGMIPDTRIGHTFGHEFIGRVIEVGSSVESLSVGDVALNWAIDSVRKGGTVSVMGAYGPLFSAVKFGDAMNKGLTIHTNQAPVARQWPRLLEHIQAGRISPRDMITHRIPLEHIAEGYHMVSAKIDGCIKAVIEPPAA